MRLNNGFEIPQIGVGTWTLRGETARQNVCLALKAGFRHVDTAQGYENEAEVGQGIADSGVPRQEIFVTTKVNTGIMRMGKQAVADSIDESLAKLNTDYIDLLLIHWPVKDCVRLAAAGLDKTSDVASELTVDTKRSGMNLSVSASEPVEKVDVVSFSGKTVKTYTAVGKKAFDMSLQDLPKEKLVLVFHSADGKATANIDLTK